MIPWHEVGAFLCGSGVGWLAHELLRAIKPVRLRCAWCGTVRVSTQGQACPACIESIAKEGRAAPEDWPAA